MTSRLCVPADAPCLDGHFPGRPIVPGAVILDAVLNAAPAHCAPEQEPFAVAACKFLSILEAGQECSIDFDAPTEQRMRFRCHCGTRVVAEGTLTLRSRP